MNPQKYADIPEDYLVSKLYEYGRDTEYVSTNKAYNCGCPICREGNSWGQKKRCFFIPDKDLVYCHNCGWSSKPYYFIREITGFDHEEVLKDLKDEGSIPSFDANAKILRLEEDTKPVEDIPELPEKCINLSDQTQIEYYKDDYHLKMALEYIQSRKLLDLVNSPRKLYYCMKGTHRHRIIIPFYDVRGEKILHYQSRSIKQYDKIRYLSKKNSNKTLFNIDKVDLSGDRYYLTEGPIDAFCVRNCMAVAGISESKTILFSPEQKAQLKEFIGMDRVWILDNQYLDNASLTKSKILVELGETIFIYPKSCKYKDLNELCIAKSLNEVPTGFIDKYSYEGTEASILLNQIKIKES